jgi:sec-independent protein translocase protein TatA
MAGSFLTPVHLALVLVVVLLLFGAKRLPEIGKSLGTGLREFKSSIDQNQSGPPELTGPVPEQEARGPGAH